MRLIRSAYLFALFTVLVAGCAMGPSGGTSQDSRPAALRCEYLNNPLGIDQTKPRLGWVVPMIGRGNRQTAYQVLVASSLENLAADRGDLWDSGKINSDENAHVEYGGKPLSSRTACYWKVRIWGYENGTPTAWSESADWSTGLLNKSDWEAQWIDTHDAVLKQVADHPVKIVRAVYETVEPATTTVATTMATTTPATTQAIVSRDVTANVAAIVKDGSLSMEVKNDLLGGDPAADVKKHLVVDYVIDGKTEKKTVTEHKTLALNGQPSRLWYLRKSFSAKPEISKATLYVTALGIYEIHLNGKRVGDHTLAPGWTDYNQRIRYQAYDVTGMVKSGANAVGAIIANGWYAGHLGNGGFQQYGKEPALLAQLEITYDDGSTEKVVTDPSWKIHQSPVMSSDFMLGEICDANAEVGGWDQPWLADGSWASASKRNEETPLLQGQVSPPVRETQLVKPISLNEPGPGLWTFDMGQNMVGVVRLKVNAPRGTKIILHHAEMLNADGRVYTTNLRGAPSVDVYMCKGGGTEVWQPRFTFHGFRYVELTGLVEKPSMDTVTGVVLGSDTPRTGSFVCSDARVNQLMSNIQWGQRGNYLSVPTDCPQRDERLGWMGDAEVFVRTATDNADVASFFSKWLVDVDDAQSSAGAFWDVSPQRGSGGGTPAWADAGVICPWTIYLAYGDKRILEQHLPAMTRWVDWCREHSNDLIRDDKNFRGGDFGDWLSINADTPKDLIGTAYFAYSTHILAQAYTVVGNVDVAARYQKLFEEIKVAFNKKYVKPDGRITGGTQCGYLMALKFDLLPEALRPMAAKHLVADIKAKDWHLSTGFVGVSYLLPMLTQTGNIDAAYRLLEQDTFPSWLFSVKHGATTIWERWDGWTPEKGFQDAGMNSFNHYSLGSCGEWLYDTVGGITWDSQQPGYKHIIIHPMPGGGMRYAKATVGSPYGSIFSGWTLENGVFELKVAIPGNTTATVSVPAHSQTNVTESGEDPQKQAGVKFVGMKNGEAVYEVESGMYDFKVVP